jgi:NCS1 family nucleobase:cation symporter-1
MVSMSEKSLDQELVETSWPLKAEERNWSSRSLFIVLLVAASATWCYIIGEYVGYYLPLAQ